MKNLIFFNESHNGDMHLSREFVKDIYKKTKNCYNKFYIYHTKSPNFYIDLDGIIFTNKRPKSNANSTIHEDDENVYVSTWIGQGNYKYLIKQGSLYSYYMMFNDIYDYLKIKMEKIEYYIPEINFSRLNQKYIDNINNFISENTILIANCDVLSNQSFKFNMGHIINYIASEYPNFKFICTTKDFTTTEENIYFTDDIINKNDIDLNEISYLSTLCKVIINKSSGPGTFTLIKDNLNDKNKVFISFCTLIEDCKWSGEAIAKQIWSNDFSYKNIIEVINNELKNLRNE